MRQKIVISISLLCLVALMGCTTLNIRMTPNRIYYEAQVAYVNAWESYHKVWSALPPDDPRKIEWVNNYHAMFLEAAELMTAWGKNPTDNDLADLANIAIDKLENVLIQLAIKKGGK